MHQAWKKTPPSCSCKIFIHGKDDHGLEDGHYPLGSDSDSEYLSASCYPHLEATCKKKKLKAQELLTVLTVRQMLAQSILLFLQLHRQT